MFNLRKNLSFNPSTRLFSGRRWVSRSSFKLVSTRVVQSHRIAQRSYTEAFGRRSRRSTRRELSQRNQRKREWKKKPASQSWFNVSTFWIEKFQRRGAKENLEQTLEMPEEVATPAVAGEEEVVVDAVDSAPISLGIRDLDTPRDFVVGPQQLLGLDHAVLQSIDRCREFTAGYWSLMNIILKILHNILTP